MDYNLWQQLILGATKPFRTGANILAQNWGSALTGKDMSQKENQGKFLQWLSEGLTPEEQQTITERPYLSALKSGAGMAATLAPFATKGLRVAKFATDPLANRLAQLTSQGALEGGLGGFGQSREGKEAQDTLLGAGMGAGGEVLADYLLNPSFRNMLNDNIKSRLPQYRNLPSGEIINQAGMNFSNTLSDQSNLYHGTSDTFTDFDTTNYGKGVGWGDQGNGIYLTEDRVAAQQFGDIAARNRALKSGSDLSLVNSQSGTVLDAKLNNDAKILDFDNLNLTSGEAKNLLRKAGIREDTLKFIGETELDTPQKVINWLNNSKDIGNSYEFLAKELGYDGIRLTDPRWSSYIGELSTDKVMPETIKTVVVYDPKLVSFQRDIPINAH